MGDYPWAVVCNIAELSDHGAATCDGSNPNAMVAVVRDEITVASINLRDRLNMNKLVIQQLTALSLGQTNLSTLPDPAVLRLYDPSVKYNMVYLTGGASSRFDTTNAIMEIAEADIGDAAGRAATGTTMDHELTHAVQAAVCKNCNDYDAAGVLNTTSPLIEGTAEAVGMLAAVNWDSSAVQGKLLYGIPRSWSSPMGRFDPYDISYYMFEFFSLANSGDLTYLMPLFHSFNGSSGHFHKRLDTAINVALGVSLPEIFMKRVMPARSFSSPNGVRYKQEDVTNTDIDHSFVATVSSMASDQYLFSDTSNGDICINVNLFQGADPELALVMLNGTEGGEAMPFGGDYTARMTTTGEVLTVNGHTADVQVVNLSTGGIADSKSYTIAAYADGACQPPAAPVECNPMKIGCDSDGCGLYVQDYGGQCWAKAASCDSQGRCTRPGFEGGFDFGSCDNLKNQMTTNIPVGDAVRDEAASVPDDRKCGDVDLGCQWIVLCPK